MLLYENEAGVEYLAGPQASPVLTARQRFARYMTTYLANDLDRGTPAEQHTAALLHLCADAIRRNYESELVRVVTAWRTQREREGV